ncbi:MAG: cupin domain-containing protein [Acidimicrobiia bacterium]
MDWQRWNLDEVVMNPMPNVDGGAAAVIAPPGTDQPFMLLVTFPPNHVVNSHWHGSDCFYLVSKGSMTVGEEGEYKPGDIRWVKGGTYYGPEVMGADGCTFMLIGVGDSAAHFEETTARVIGSVVRP